MIRRPDDFPDIDRAIEDARHPPVLDYRRRDPRDGLVDVPVGRYLRRIAFVIGLAALCGGLGSSISHDRDGPGWMAVGAGILGLILPIPGRRNE